MNSPEGRGCSPGSGRQALEIGRVSGRQFVTMIMMPRLFWSTVVMPAAVTTGATRDVWLGPLIAGLAAMVLGWAIATLAERHPGETILGIALRVLGRPLGTFLGLLLVTFFVLVTAAASRTLGESYTAAILPDTPPLVPIVAMLLLAGLAARAGLEVLARGTEAGFWVALLATLAILVLPVGMMRFNHLLPFLENGWHPVLRATIGSFVYYADVLLAAGMVLPYLGRPRQAGGAILGGTAVSTAIDTLVAVTVLAIFGPALNSLDSPFVSQARMINLGHFLERLEILPTTAWTLTAWLKAGFFVWASALGLGQVLGLGSYRPLVFPLCFLCGAVAVWAFRDTTQLLRYLGDEVLGAFGSVFAIVFVVLLVLGSLVRGRSAGGAGQTDG